MTPHDHRTFVSGCFRCELGRDELESALATERDELREAGDRMAAAIRRRWTGEGPCKCEVCTAADEWEAL